MKENKMARMVVSLLVITAGSFLAAYAIEGFLVPNLILDGGVVGVAIIVGELTRLQLSILVAIFNIPFLFIGYRQIGKNFLVKAIFGIVLYSVFLGIFEHVPAFTNDSILATVFGGLLLGIGVGLVIKAGGCLDGTETIGILISKKTSMTVGQVVLLFNVIIFAVAGCLFGFDRTMYSLITYFITSKIIDLVDSGFEQAKAVMIITNESQRISDAIFARLGRTVTLIEGEGMISGKKVVLYCVVTRIELSEMKRIVKEDDASAFMTITDVSEIVGKHIKKKEEQNKEKLIEDTCGE